MVMTGRLPVDAQNRLDTELSRDEKVVWTGQPAPGLKYQMQTIPLVLFGIPWTAFSIFWVTMAFTMTHHSSHTPETFPFSLFPYVFPLFGLPFVGVGFWMLSSPYWQMRKASKTVYALTDRRALLLEPTWRGEVMVRSIPPEHLKDRTRTQDKDGVGTLTFTQLTTVSTTAKGGTTTLTVGFQNIPDVKAVDELVTRTFAQNNAGTS